MRMGNKCSLKNVPVRQVITSFAGLRAHEDSHEFVIGEIPEKAMGARIHASISGVVESVADGMVTIKA